MIFRVYHLDDQAVYGQGDPRLDALFFAAKTGFSNVEKQQNACREIHKMGAYTLAATVNARDVDEAWHLTNHVDSDWTLGASCQAALGPQRSSSVGDLFEDENGKFLLCASIGWRPIELAAPAPKTRHAF